MAKDSQLDPVEELRQSVSVPFENARAMPTSVYTSDAFLAEELTHIFRKDW